MSIRIRLYNLVTRCTVCTLAPFLRHHPRFAERFQERFGDWCLSRSDDYIWIHGASAGELSGLMRLVPWIRLRYPEHKILVTSFSLAGITMHRDKADLCRLLPFDSEKWIGKAIGDVSITLFLFGKTEIWPLVLTKLASRGVPICMVNGRIERKNLARYRLLLKIFPQLFSLLSQALVVSEAMKKHLLMLGMKEDQIQITGNTKYDHEPLCSDDLKDLMGVLDSLTEGKEKRVRLTLGSIHPGEESWWLPELIRLKEKRLLQGKTSSSPLLILVPRHLEKLEYFKEKLEALSLSYLCSSDLQNLDLQAIDVLLVDEFGKLEKYYALSDFAFIGGTLVPVGGHNPFEPAPYKVPIGIGMHTSKIRSEVEALTRHDAFMSIHDRGAIEEILSATIESSSELKARAERLYSVWSEARGSLKRVEHALDDLLGFKGFADREEVATSCDVLRGSNRHGAEG